MTVVVCFFHQFKNGEGVYRRFGDTKCGGLLQMNTLGLEQALKHVFNVLEAMNPRLGVKHKQQTNNRNQPMDE